MGALIWTMEGAIGMRNLELALMFRKDHFTASLELQFAVKNESQPEDEAGGVRQKSLALPEPKPEISPPSATA